MHPDDRDQKNAQRSWFTDVYFRLSGRFCSLFPGSVCEACKASRKDALAVSVILFSVIFVSNVIYHITDFLPWFETIGPLRSAIGYVYSLMSDVSVFAVSIFLFPLELTWYFFTLIASLFSRVIPNFPNLTIPDWYGNLAVPSVLLSRLFKISDEIVPTNLRGGLRDSLPEEDQILLRKTGHPWIRGLWYLGDQLNTVFYWNTLMNPLQVRLLPWVFGRLLRTLGVGEDTAASIFRNLAYTAGGLLLLGYPKVLGYVLYLFKNRGLDYPVLDNYKRWFGSLISLVVFVTVLSTSLIVFERVLVELFEPSADQFI